MAKRSRSHIPLSRRTALVVAPRRSGAGEIVAALEKEGLRVRTARDLFEALVMFLSEPTKLVVISLEGLTRKDRSVLPQFRWRAPEVRILLLVPEGRRSHVPVFGRAGADASLPAPASSAEIRLLVRTLLRGDAADPLTGLPNKEAYENAFEREASRTRREDLSFGLAIVDLDGFKKINTDCDYELANQVLCEVADRLKASFRITDLVTRYGGDEFVILITQLPGELEETRKTAGSVLARARSDTSTEPMSVICPKPEPLHVTLKAGVAFYPHEGKERAALFKIANARLKRAADAGGDCIVDRDE